MRREGLAEEETGTTETEQARTRRAGTKAYNKAAAGKSEAFGWKPRYNTSNVGEAGAKAANKAEQEQMRSNKNTSSRRAAAEKKATLKTDYEKYTGKNADDRIKESSEQRVAENKKAYETKMSGKASPSASNTTPTPSSSLVYTT